MVKVRRMLRWYDPAGDTLIGEAELRGVGLTMLQRLVGAPSGDALYDCWPVPTERLDELAAFTKISVVGLERFVYFVEADGDE